MKAIRTDIVASLAAASVLTGMQGIAPALPAMQEELGLSQFDLSFIVVGYVLPGALFAFPAGLIADRFGMSRVIAAALTIFGMCGIVLFFWHSFALLLALRVIQGAMFGAVLALTIASVSRSANVQDLTVAQSRRVIVIALGESAAPLLSGIAIEASSWNSVFLIQALSIPMAFACYYLLPSEITSSSSQAPPSTRDVAKASWSAILSLQGVAVQLPGFFRFFLKYALLTFAPILAVSSYGMSPVEVGSMLAFASLGGVGAAVAVPWLARRIGVTGVLVVSLVVTSLPIVLLSSGATAAWLIFFVILSGVGDGALAVVNNVIIAKVAPPHARGAYIGISGGVRNAGKIAAPVVVGALAGAFPLAVALGILGALGLFAVGVSPGVSKALNSDS